MTQQSLSTVQEDESASTLEKISENKSFASVQPFCRKNKKNGKKALEYRRVHSTLPASRSPSPVRRSNSTPRTGTPLKAVSGRKTPRKTRAVPLDQGRKHTDKSSIVSSRFSFGSPKRNRKKNLSTASTKESNKGQLSKALSTDSKQDHLVAEKHDNMIVENFQDLRVSISYVKEVLKSNPAVCSEEETQEVLPEEGSNEESRKKGLGNSQEEEVSKDNLPEDDKAKATEESFFAAWINCFSSRSADDGVKGIENSAGSAKDATGSSEDAAGSAEGSAGRSEDVVGNAQIHEGSSQITAEKSLFALEKIDKMEKSFNEIADGVVAIVEKERDGKLSSEEKSKLHSEVKETTKIISKHVTKLVENENADNDNTLNSTNTTKNSGKKTDVGLTDCIQFYMSPALGLSLCAFFDGLQEAVDEKKKKDQGENVTDFTQENLASDFVLNEDGSFAVRNIKETGEKIPEEMKQTLNEKNEVQKNNIPDLSPGNPDFDFSLNEDAEQASFEKNEDEKEVSVDDSEEQINAHEEEQEQVLVNVEEGKKSSVSEEEQKQVRFDCDDEQSQTTFGNVTQDLKRMIIEQESNEESVDSTNSSESDHGLEGTKEPNIYVKSCASESNFIFRMIYSLHTCFDHTELDSVIKNLSEKTCRNACTTYYNSDSD